jgi:hypothetical protein
MIKKIGNLILNYNKLIAVFESSQTGSSSTYVSPKWTSEQIDKFVKNNYTNQQIDYWKNYNIESASMDYMSGTELIKLYIAKNLDASMLAEQNIDCDIIGWNIQKQSPGHFTVPHYDLYHSVNTYNPLEIARFWIPMEDAKFGHALFVNNTALTEFKAGEIYDWDIEDLHSAVNAGVDPRYTLLLYLKKSK